ncbi:hypothetical protein FN846DRAFT_887945 [Sphaerosporella brunnea]|uniref:Uncharacterized protein n=1 Tax=Sphaerosporella brunnea TaxID=1250544 RepID=A0A5J5F509_9PEZI|nr:hypothetical protein FN846DRAFT_887945 [Sphaerosporella brunnea]
MDNSVEGFCKTETPLLLLYVLTVAPHPVQGRDPAPQVVQVAQGPVVVQDPAPHGVQVSQGPVAQPVLPLLAAAGPAFAALPDVPVAALLPAIPHAAPPRPLGLIH